MTISLSSQIVKALLLGVSICASLVDNVSAIDVSNYRPFTDYSLQIPRLASSNSNQNKDNFPSQIHINANIFGNRVDDKFYLFHGQSDKNSKVEVMNGDNKITKESIFVTRTYHADLPKFKGWGTITIENTDIESSRKFRGIFNLNSELYQVDLTSDQLVHNSTVRNAQISQIQAANLNQTGMTIAKSADIQEKDATCGTTNHNVLQTQDAHNTPEFINKSMTISTNKSKNARVERWSSCYDGDSTIHQVSMGIAVDAGFYQTFGNHAAVQNYIANMVAAANKITSVQFSIFIKITDVVMFSDTGANTPVWNRKPGSVAKCGTTIDQTLNDFTTWRAANKRNSLWVLLTNCFPSPGTIGLAWISTLCDPYYSSAVVTKTTTTWLTFMHEAAGGHTFGAQHVWGSNTANQGKLGSIMDYRNQLYKGEYQFADIYSKTQICSKLQSQVNNKYTQPFCMQPYAAVCGNGIIEQGEVCDDASACCVNCQLAPKAQCSGNSGCCSNTCQFLPTTTLCGQTGYCANGKCQDSSCLSYTGLSFCGLNPANTCRQQCQSTSTCTDKYTQPNVVIADGIVCSNNGQLSTCKSGVCQPVTPIPNPTPVQVNPVVQPINSALVTETLTGFDILEQNVGLPIQANDAEACRQILASNANTQSVVYKESTKMCYPKSAGINMGIIDPSLKVFAKKNVDWMLTNIDFMGSDLNSYTTADSLTCHFQCKTNPLCVGVLFYSNRCYFKKGPGVTRALVNAKYYVN